MQVVVVTMATSFFLVLWRHCRSAHARPEGLSKALEYFNTYICFVASCLDNVHGGVAHGNGGGRGYRDRPINTLTTGMS